ncbi:hypothetical protein ACI6PS_08680 [Flavobacterium sp. PLA-1-15]|uniref:hypothetical protein n=1 Tax=Flavobacterium sp. PLA-1-15 TaxID=3380533 RepID=UPI003B7EDC4B
MIRFLLRRNDKAGYSFSVHHQLHIPYHQNGIVQLSSRAQSRDHHEYLQKQDNSVVIPTQEESHKVTPQARPQIMKFLLRQNNKLDYQ